ncbi:MAG: type II secretion system protein [Pseudomonadota bacterium]
MKRKARRPGGFTMFELLLVIAIVGILAAVFLNRVLWYQERAEKAAMEQVAAVVQSALNLQVAKLAVEGRLAEAGLLTSENPMNWLAQRPSNYRGEFFDPDDGKVAAGGWYYDLKSHELVYLVELAEHFQPQEQGGRRVRYRVKIVYNKDGRDIGGVVVEPVGSYGWFAG